VAGHFQPMLSACCRFSEQHPARPELSDAVADRRAHSQIGESSPPLRFPFDPDLKLISPNESRIGAICSKSNIGGAVDSATGPYNHFLTEHSPAPGPVSDDARCAPLNPDAEIGCTACAKSKPGDMATLRLSARHGRQEQRSEQERLQKARQMRTQRR
jgi:hypothetical protein